MIKELINIGEFIVKNSHKISAYIGTACLSVSFVSTIASSISLKIFEKRNNVLMFNLFLDGAYFVKSSKAGYRLFTNEGGHYRLIGEFKSLKDIEKEIAR